MAYRDHGPAGAAEVWLALHGGPGSGSSPGLLLAFDLKRQRVVVPDQRGSGSSLPRGCLRANTLQHLVQDLERLRQHLGVERWHILGGSWGATLALAYAQAHPHRVGRLVLRGSFDASPQTVRRLFHRHWAGKPVAGHSLDNRAMCQQLSQLFHLGTLTVTQSGTLRRWEAMETRAALAGAWRSVLHAGNPAERVAARQHWRQMHRYSRRLLSRPLPHLVGVQLRRKFRIQAHYLARGCGLRPGNWSSWQRRLAQSGVRVDWVHGRHDPVCPPRVALEGHARWGQHAAHGGLSRLHRVNGGHLGTDPAVLAALRACVQRRP